MLNREACERRVYRLALLLTGRPQAATAVIEQVVGIKPDLDNLDSAHLDRLTVLRSREQLIEPIQVPGLEPQFAAALAGLTGQQREAWIFISLYQLDDRSTAKAMDCSFRAVRQHHDQAAAQLRTLFGAEQHELVDAVRDVMLHVDVPAFYRESQQRKRRMRRAVIIALVIVSVMAVLAAVSWLAQQLV